MPRSPRSPFDDRPFLRLSAIQSRAVPQSTELDQLDQLVSKIERSQRWRSSSGVDLEPYSHVLRTHLRSLRSSRSPAPQDRTFLRSARRLVCLLESLTAREPVTTRAKSA